MMACTCAEMFSGDAAGGHDEAADSPLGFVIAALGSAGGTVRTCTRRLPTSVPLSFGQKRGCEKLSRPSTAVSCRQVRQWQTRATQYETHLLQRARDLLLVPRHVEDENLARFEHERDYGRRDEHSDEE